MQFLYGGRYVAVVVDDYFRVIVTYGDGETSGNRVFKDREKAEEWAARQQKSPTVKKAVIEPFVRQQYAGRRVSRH
jgi:hypothetical protein